MAAKSKPVTPLVFLLLLALPALPLRAEDPLTLAGAMQRARENAREVTAARTRHEAAEG